MRFSRTSRRCFLRQNVEGELWRRVLDPFRCFSSSGRTETAVEYYEEKVFQDATFADMLRRDGPMIVINASDLARGVRFSFLQDYFDLLCSGLSPFPVARALTASSAASWSLAGRTRSSGVGSPDSSKSILEPSESAP